MGSRGHAFLWGRGSVTALSVASRDPPCWLPCALRRPLPSEPGRSETLLTLLRPHVRRDSRCAEPGSGETAAWGKSQTGLQPGAKKKPPGVGAFGAKRREPR